MYGVVDIRFRVPYCATRCIKLGNARIVESLVGSNVGGQNEVLGMNYYWRSTCAQFSCLAGVSAVFSSPSSTSMSSCAELRLVPKLSEEVPPTSEGGPHFFPVAPEVNSGRGRGNESTINAPVRKRPPRGVPPGAVVDIRCFHVIGETSLMLCPSFLERSLAIQGYGGCSHATQVWFRFLRAR